MLSPLSDFELSSLFTFLVSLGWDSSDEDELELDSLEVEYFLLFRDFFDFLDFLDFLDFFFLLTGVPDLLESLDSSLRFDLDRDRL